MLLRILQIHAESLLHSLEQAARNMSFYVDADKTIPVF